MDPSQLSPLSSTPFSTPTRSGGGSSMIVLVLAGLFGIGTIGFGIATLSVSSQLSSLQKTTSARIGAAVKSAKDQQQQTDTKANADANNSPFRSYVAPVSYGSFEIKFPKTWSSYVTENTSGIQVSLVLNPDFVRKTNGIDDPAATKVILSQQTGDQYLNSFQSLIKTGKLKEATTTISGQKAYDLTGQFIDKRTVRAVVVPVRDKVMVFSTESSRYPNEFNEILAQAKIIP